MEQTASTDLIVVGYDGSSAADRALRWAIAEGRRRTSPVRVVHVAEWPVMAMPGEPGWLSEDQMLQAKTDLDRAVEAAGGGTHDISIVEGPVVATLCEMSRDASMMVLGARGSGGFHGLLIGSVVLSVAAHASCSVIAVRGDEPADAARLPIVVGLDDSETSRMAVSFAFAEAQMRGCDVVAVRAWRPGPDELGEIETAERVAMREMLAADARTHPHVPFTMRLVTGRPAGTLIEASREAQLVVVGSRGMGGFKGLLLGSVGQHLLQHAHCPVAVVR